MFRSCFSNQSSNVFDKAPKYNLSIYINLYKKEEVTPYITLLVEITYTY